MFINYGEITNLYEKFVKPKQTFEYLNRYSELPTSSNNQQWRWEDKDFPRVVSLLEFKKFFTENNFYFKKVLSFNGINDPEYQYVNYNTIINYNYLEDTIKHDLHNLDIIDNDFDFFMCNQTLEHVYDPCLVLRNIHKRLKSGALFYCNVPSFNMAHDTPHHHYVGMTPVGLGCIVQQAGFEIIDIGFWGNTEYINYMMNNNDWPDYRKISNYSSEINKEVITWVFAKKI